jgi:protein gp37
MISTENDVRANFVNSVFASMTAAPAASESVITHQTLRLLGMIRSRLCVQRNPIGSYQISAAYEMDQLMDQSMPNVELGSMLTSTTPPYQV